MAAPPKFLAVILLIFVTAELVWSWRHSRGVYNLRESMSNLGMMVVNRMLKPVAAAWGFIVLSLFEPLQVFRIPETAWGVVTSFIVVDFAYYWVPPVQPRGACHVGDAPYASLESLDELQHRASAQLGRQVREPPVLCAAGAGRCTPRHIGRVAGDRPAVSVLLAHGVDRPTGLV